MRFTLKKSCACWFPHCTSSPALSSRRCAGEYLSRGPRKGLRQVVMPKQDVPSLGDSPCISAWWFPTRHRAAKMLQLCARRHHPESMQLRTVPQTPESSRCTAVTPQPTRYATPHTAPRPRHGRRGGAARVLIPGTAERSAPGRFA